jgi:hypothetical protein
MKGRRKFISNQWSLLTQYQTVAGRALASRSKKNASRFLDAALIFGRDFEPIGRLAGDSRMLSVEEHHNASPPQNLIRQKSTAITEPTSASPSDN